MRNITLFFLALCCLGLLGCAKRDPIKAFVTTLDDTTAEVVKKIESGDISAAKKAFDAKKSDLKEQFAALKKVPDAQVSKEAREKFAASLKKDLEALNGALAAHSNRKPSVEDKAEGLKWVLEEEVLKKLSEDYHDIFK
jgi:hypothetical protein